MSLVIATVLDLFNCSDFYKVQYHSNYIFTDLGMIVEVRMTTCGRDLLRFWEKQGARQLNLYTCVVYGKIIEKHNCHIETMTFQIYPHVMLCTLVVL